MKFTLNNDIFFIVLLVIILIYAILLASAINKNITKPDHKIYVPVVISIESKEDIKTVIDDIIKNIEEND